MNLRKAALEALDRIAEDLESLGSLPGSWIVEDIATIRAALSEPAAEPVAWREAVTRAEAMLREHARWSEDVDKRGGGHAEDIVIVSLPNHVRIIDMADDLRDLLAAPPAAEPVAWRWPIPDNEGDWYIVDGPKCPRPDVPGWEPLYVAPPAQEGAPEGWKLVPIEPTRGRLISMAMRDDHGLGVPGYYDSPLVREDGITHAQRMESAIRIMRQLYEEAIGEGFYRDGLESEYLAAAPKPEEKP